MNIKLLIEGGDMKPGPAIAQQLGPMGINMGKVISEVNNATRNFKGMKVPVELDINEKTKEFTVKTFSPPTSELIKKELNLEKGSNDHKKIKVGNASIEDVIKIAKVKYQNMLEKDFKAAVKSILGTCASVGILVENTSPNELIRQVEEGKFDREINEQISETKPEKRKELNEYFKAVKKEQDIRLEAEKKAAEEAEKKEEPAEKSEEKAAAGKPAAGKSAEAPANKK
jgi:large subunit ribosomal protein L11